MMKEPTATKLFIGQVPREWTEENLKEIFEPFGEIHSLILLKDKGSFEHKGCAFLTYMDNDAAKAAQNEVHESRTLPGARNPIQVKPASSETSEDRRKLFVGMISKSCTADDLKEMFSTYGTIEDVSILKNSSDGASKGCAFIKFETRLQATNAIKGLHNSMTMEGCRAPIVVKIADTEKDKHMKKMMQQGGSPSVLTSNIGVPVMQQATMSASGYAGLAAQLAYYQQVFQQMGLPQVIAAAPGAIATQQLPTSQPATARGTVGYNTPSAAGGYTGAAGGYTGTGGGYTGAGGGYTGAGVVGDNAIQQAYSGIPHYMATSLPTSYATAQNGAQFSGNTKKEGPEGANLFIFQIPTEFSDSDLMQTFQPFGTVLSAKVFIDKTTGMSKGFGFVSYDNASSASAAISAMNGFAIGSRRLKVQLKRPKDQSKPY